MSGVKPVVDMLLTYKKWFGVEPIKLGGRRLVFCMFYACEQGGALSRHALA